MVVPAHPKVHALWAYDLAQMMGFLGSQAVPAELIEAVSLSFVTGTYVHTARQDLAQEALNCGADYLLWLDSDHRFPKDIALRLMAHDKDVVGINYSQRGVPPDFVAIKNLDTENGESEKLVTDVDSTGLEKVDAVGFGAVLMKANVFADLPDPQEEPWFWYEWLPHLGQQIGEDVYFCRLLREAGYDLWVDHDLSKECKHVGDFEYQVEHAAASQEDSGLIVEA